MIGEIPSLRQDDLMGQLANSRFIESFSLTAKPIPRLQVSILPGSLKKVWVSQYS